jgi:hypothetical protein
LIKKTVLDENNYDHYRYTDHTCYYATLRLDL